MFSGGFEKSATLAMLITHLKVGPQKWTAMVITSNNQLDHTDYCITHLYKCMAEELVGNQQMEQMARRDRLGYEGNFSSGELLFRYMNSKSPLAFRLPLWCIISMQTLTCGAFLLLRDKMTLQSRGEINATESHLRLAAVRDKTWKRFVPKLIEWLDPGPIRYPKRVLSINQDAPWGLDFICLFLPLACGVCSAYMTLISQFWFAKNAQNFEPPKEISSY